MWSPARGVKVGFLADGLDIDNPDLNPAGRQPRRCRLPGSRRTATAPSTSPRVPAHNRYTAPSARTGVYGVGTRQVRPKTLATATVDRLLHHAHLITTQGDSHRLQQALAGKGVKALT